MRRLDEPVQGPSIATLVGTDGAAPATAQATPAALPLSAAPADCFGAISQLFPPQHQARARRIVLRESKNRPSAQNRRSSAAGCFQLMRLHAGRFAKLGYDWSRDRYDARANTAVAYDLFVTQGWSPWA